VSDIPVIDVAPLVAEVYDERAIADVASALDRACRQTGFFCIVGHGVDPALQAALDHAARRFFSLPDRQKAAVAMARGGRAWRGWFPLGGELTSGVADDKEGIYFGQELDDRDPRVRAGIPLHGANLFPERPVELRPAVLRYLDAMTALGHALCRGLSVALGLDADWFVEHLTRDPVILFRIFRYPPVPPDADRWGVAEHTDYGLLTILAQDDRGGLEVHSADGWTAVPPIPDSFVCNLGDMLERLTRGRYRSTPHRVRNRSGTDRLSFPFFFDPSWDAEVEPLPLAASPDDRRAEERWDHACVADHEGTYGAYLLKKVAKVFPQLAHEHVAGADRT
jgi:isopenicillin N synthase-like dioxygenase